MTDDTANVIDPTQTPSGDGCVECLAGQDSGWWVHLRRCATCGHIGCCDTSPSRHASRHAAASGHPIIRSFEPGEEWFFDFRTGAFLEGPPLAPPDAHPVSQPVPAPPERVPVDWMDHLNP